MAVPFCVLLPEALFSYGEACMLKAVPEVLCGANTGDRLSRKLEPSL